MRVVSGSRCTSSSSCWYSLYIFISRLVAAVGVDPQPFWILGQYTRYSTSGHSFFILETFAQRTSLSVNLVDFRIRNLKTTRNIIEGFCFVVVSASHICVSLSHFWCAMFYKLVVAV
jgi:hypothetical protein